MTSQSKIALHAGTQGYNTFEAGPNQHSFDGADEAYLNALGLDRVCREVGRKPGDWDEIKSEWLAAFRAGWEEAYLGYHTIPYNGQ
jgi:hypothetical protein